jgi:2-amino-4-hydroxy-6-hydroxymethyldihydropteridine diphosphokinase
MTDARVSPAERVYIALGSNVGDRETHLAHARTRLAALPGTRVLGASSVEETAPLAGGPAVPQEPYLNQMVLLETTLPPARLLRECLAIEAERGRDRTGPGTERWGPRTLDLDIVRYGARTVAEPGLTIPHPELPRRDFWRREIAELERVVHV